MRAGLVAVLLALLCAVPAAEAATRRAPCAEGAKQPRCVFTDVDLGGHLVKLHNAGKPDPFVFGYPFRPGTVLQPGRRCGSTRAARRPTTRPWSVTPAAPRTCWPTARAS